MLVNRSVPLIELLSYLYPKTLGFIRSLNSKIKTNFTFCVSKTGLHDRLSNILDARLECWIEQLRKIRLEKKID